MALGGAAILDPLEVTAHVEYALNFAAPNPPLEKHIPK